MELSKSDIGRFDRRCSNRLACEQIGIRAPSMARQWGNACRIKRARDKFVQSVSFDESKHPRRKFSLYVRA